MGFCYRSAKPGVLVIALLLGWTLDTFAGTSALEKVDPPVSSIKRRVDSLQALTQPGYYPALLAQQQADRIALAAANCTTLCSTSAASTPVTLVSFAGERIDESQVRLAWETSNELNNDYFAVQRSLSPVTGFEAVASVKGSGTSSRSHSYQTIDPNSYADVSYYRLNQVDLDGTSSYSRVVSIPGTRLPLGIRAFPNPATQRNLNFQATGLKDGEMLSVVVYDARGVVIYQNPTCTPDAKAQFSIPGLSTVQPGSYYLKVTTTTQQAGTKFVFLP